MRIVNTIKNVSTNVLTNLISLGISFLNRTFFLMVLDATYLGVNGLFSNILLIFSLAELGVGAALTQMMYKPLAEKDDVKLAGVFKLTKYVLCSIGTIIFLLGLIFTPFLNLFVNDINVIPNLRVIFLLFTISTSSTYFFSYYITLITADQKAHKLFGINITAKVVTFLVQNIFLFFTRNFIVYLVCQILCNILFNFIICRYVRKQYSFFKIKKVPKLKREEYKSFLKNTEGLFLYRVSMTVTQGTDNIVISKFLNIVFVGLVSNYVMITQSAASLIDTVFSSILASVGNLCVMENGQKKREVFDNLNFLSFWCYSFVSISIFVLINPFIELWLGPSFTLPQIVTFFLCFDIYLVGLVRVSGLYRTAEGLFWYGKLRPLCQAILNLAISIVLVKLTGQLWAVFAGTVISRLLTSTWFDPYIIFKYVFQEKPIKYYLDVCLKSALALGVGTATAFLATLIPLRSFPGLVLKGLLCVVLVNGVFVLLFRKTQEFQYLKGIIGSVTGKTTNFFKKMFSKLRH